MISVSRIKVTLGNPAAKQVSVWEATGRVKLRLTAFLGSGSRTRKGKEIYWFIRQSYDAILYVTLVPASFSLPVKLCRLMSDHIYKAHLLGKNPTFIWFHTGFFPFKQKSFRKIFHVTFLSSLADMGRVNYSVHYLC